MARELRDRGLTVERQVPVPILYKDIRFDEGLRADIILNFGEALMEADITRCVNGLEE